ncbi:MAG: hypothetical protein AAF699_18165, partial [Pseudomonadota bacterium]
MAATVGFTALSRATGAAAEPWSNSIRETETDAFAFRVVRAHRANTAFCYRQSSRPTIAGV